MRMPRSAKIRDVFAIYRFGPFRHSLRCRRHYLSYPEVDSGHLEIFLTSHGRPVLACRGHPRLFCVPSAKPASMARQAQTKLHITEEWLKVTGTRRSELT